jgi:Bacterial hydrolase
MILECGCPSQYPPWHNEDVDLGGHSVHTMPIPTPLHMPVGYEIYRGRQQRSLDELQLKEPWPGLILTRTGLLRGSIMHLLEEANSLSRHVKRLPYPFSLRAFLHHGNLATARKAITDMQMSLFDAGHRPRELYLCYLTCPRCSEQRGGEKMLLLRRWEKSERLAKRLQTK